MARYQTLGVRAVPLLLALAIAAVSAREGPTAEAPRRNDIKPQWATDAGVADFINTQIRAQREAARPDRSRNQTRRDDPPLELATDAQWCRRVFLDVIGRIPKIEELNRFQAAPRATKKADLVDQLLTSEIYAHEYARYWATIWSNVLIGRPPTGETQQPLTNRDGLRQYLYRSMLGNKPYDLLVYELLTATGATTPGEANFNGATNYLVDKLPSGGVEATEHVGRCFLGLRMRCAQCHCDPCGNRRPGDFWNLNAFFRQAQASPLDASGRGHAVLRDVDFVGDSGDRQEAESYFELLGGKLLAAYPQFVDGTKIDPNGKVQVVNRRAELARLVLRSDNLAKVAVNRLWAHFHGYGFCNPVDDLEIYPLFGHRDLLTGLGREFAARGYDLKRLIRWCVLSEPYGLSSRVTAGNQHDDPTLVHEPLFSRFYVRRMQPEQVFESVLTAAGSQVVDWSEASPAGLDEVRRQVIVAFGSDADRTPSRIGNVQQLLFMMNGELTARATSAAPPSFLHRLTARGLPEQKAVEWMFAAAFGRKPSASELATTRELLAAYASDRSSAYQDIWWALLNSNEFILVY